MATASVTRCPRALPSSDDFAQPAVMPAILPQRRMRVVLVDDEPSILKTWRAILEAHDFDAVCCEHASDALAAILDGCDCVVTDYHMPDMTGIEVIVAGKQITRAPFIVMTGNDSPKLRAAASAAGAACIVAKPAPIKSVLEIIAKLCRRSSP